MKVIHLFYWELGEKVRSRYYTKWNVGCPYCQCLSVMYTSLSTRKTFLCQFVRKLTTAVGIRILLTTLIAARFNFICFFRIAFVLTYCGEREERRSGGGMEGGVGSRQREGERECV